MTTTTSSSNEKGRMLHLYRQILRRYLGVTVLYFLLQFLFFPMQYVLTAADALQTIAQKGPRAEITAFLGNGGIYNGVSQPVMLVMMVVLPVIYPLAQMSYLHRKKSVDLYHALPIRREKLLLVNFAASLTLIFCPLLLNFLFVLIAGLGFGFSSFSVPGLLYELLLITASVCGILALCYLTSVLAGTVLDNLVYIAAALFGLPVTLYTAYAQLDRLLYGFSAGGLRLFPTLLSPATCPIRSCFIAYSTRGTPGISLSPVLIASLCWLLLCPLILWLAARLYRRRPSELAGQTGVQNGFILFYKLLGALFGGVCLSMLFTSVSNVERLFISLPAALIGGAISYCLAEVLLARGFKTLRRSLSMVALGALLPTVFLLIAGTGGLGYESRIPQAEDIEAITLDYYYDRYEFTRYSLAGMRETFTGTDAESMKRRSLIYDRSLTLQQPEAVDLIRRLHAAAANNEDSGGSFGRHQGMQLSYRLKNGQTLSRNYPTLPKEAEALYDAINALEETKRQMHPIFTYTPADIREITLMDRLMAGLTPLALSQEEMGQLCEALRADMLEETYEQMVSPKVIGYLSMTPQRDSRYWEKLTRSPALVLPEGDTGFEDCYVALTPSYTRTLSLLRQWGYGGFETVDFSTIHAAYLQLEGYYNAGLSLTGPRYFSSSSLSEDNADALFYMPYCTEVRDPKSIEQLCSLIRYNPTESLIPISLSDEEQESLSGQYWNDLTTLSITLSGDNNYSMRFTIRPSDVPRETLELLREHFGHQWSEELFDVLLEKIYDPAASAAGQEAGAAGVYTAEDKRFLNFRF